jgi:hypothetical protein
MHDGVSLEALGVPTAVVVTTAFVHEAEVQRAALGMTGLVPVVIEHPLSSIPEEEIRARAREARDPVERAWRGTLADRAV